MAITDPEVIVFSNNVIRTAADEMAGLYYDCELLKNQRDAQGDAQAFIDIYETQIRLASDRMRDWIINSSTRDNAWFNVGTPTPLNTKTPNSNAEDVEDGSPADGRPGITGADIHTIVSHLLQYQNWMMDASFGGPGSGTSYEAMLNSIIVCGGDGNQPLRTGEVDNFVLNRCNEIIVEYQANGNLKLNQLLAVAPNPRSNF